MEIRKAVVGDIKKLSKLFDGYRVFYEKKTDLKSAETFLLERIQNNESKIFVAEDKATRRPGWLA